MGDRATYEELKDELGLDHFEGLRRTGSNHWCAIWRGRMPPFSMEQHDDHQTLGSPSPRRPSGRWVTVLSIIGAALLLLALGLSNPPWGKAAAWAVCLLLALVGWGGVVERLLGDRAPTGWALRAVWGIAAVLAVGGPLAAFHIASKPVLLAQVIIGLLLAVYFAFVRRAQQGESPVPRVCENCRPTRSRHVRLCDPALLRLPGV